MTRAAVVRLLLVVFVTTACGESQDAAPPPDAAASVVRLAGTACLTPILGSAVVIGDGLVLAAAHTIAGAEDDLRVVTLQGAEHPVVVVGFDPERDLTLLRVDSLDAPALELGTAAAEDVGAILAVNRELELDVIDYTVRRVINARSGNIYDEGRVERTALDLAADIFPGASGAPLVNESGEIVGIVFASSRTTDDVSYALHSDEVSAFLQGVDRSTEVERGRCR